MNGRICGPGRGHLHGGYRPWWPLWLCPGCHPIDKIPSLPAIGAQQPPV